MKIAIYTPSAKETNRWVDLVRERLPAHGLTAEVTAVLSPEEAAPDADYAIGWQPYPEFFARHPRLKAFFNMGAGLDHFFLKPSMKGKLPASVALVRLEDAGMAQQMTDYCRHQVFDWMYGFARYRSQQASAEWRGWREKHALDRSQLSIGVLGLGVLGAAVAQAFAQDGFTVFGHARSKREVAGVKFEADLQKFLSLSRVLIVLAPATPQTRHLLNANTLAMLPAQAYIINLARGALINDGDLLAALDTEQIAGACLDVFDTEPLPREHAYWSHPKVVVTPHASAPTLMRPSAEQILGKLAKLQQGQVITGIASIENAY